MLNEAQPGNRVAILLPGPGSDACAPAAAQCGFRTRRGSQGVPVGVHSARVPCTTALGGTAWVGGPGRSPLHGGGTGPAWGAMRLTTHRAGGAPTSSLQDLIMTIDGHTIAAMVQTEIPSSTLERCRSSPAARWGGGVGVSRGAAGVAELSVSPRPSAPPNPTPTARPLPHAQSDQDGAALQNQHLVCASGAGL